MQTEAFMRSGFEWIAPLEKPQDRPVKVYDIIES